MERELATSVPDASVGDLTWWQTGIVYQIFPLTFMDANGDGTGDLDGITARLDYLASLSVDAVWLAPIYPSPMADFGYDVSDHTAINPLFGSMADFDRLLAEVHARGLRLILDLVPNHTSDMHPWFLESRADRYNPKRDWYIWCDPAPDGSVPNNWVSYWGSAWTFDDRTGQYYLHQFRDSQPELNYRNPLVLTAMLEVMRFWLDKGVDGFRVDVIALLAKDELFRDEPLNPDYQPGQMPYHSLQHPFTQDQPAVHDLIRAMRSVLDEYDDRVMLGELDPIPNLMRYYGAALDECHLPFNFQLIYAPWDAQVIRRIVEQYEAALPAGAWPNWVLGNHDQRRVASRAGANQARIAQMLLLTLRGTPILYYGDELGMSDGVVPPDALRERTGLDPRDPSRFSRDPQRTPMQWGPQPNAGFCPPNVVPWLPVATDYQRVNVEVEGHEPRSMLTLFRRLTALRRATPALSGGSFRSLDGSSRYVFAFERRAGGESFVIALNFGDTAQDVDASRLGGRAELVLSTELDRHVPRSLTRIRLRANEGVIVRVL